MQVYDTSGLKKYGVISLAAIATATVLGNVSGSPATPTALTATQLTTLVNSFTSSLSGAVPASGGGTTNFLRADGSFAAPASPVGATPTATVGLTAIAGSAATWMRSDGAPALNVGISPTWTGNHTHTPSSGVGGVYNGTAGNPGLEVIGAAGAGNSFGLFIQAGANGSDYGARINTKAGNNLINLAGSGAITFGNTNDNGAYTFNGTGVMSIGGPIQASQSSTSYVSHNYINPNAGVGAGIRAEYLNNVTAALALGIASSFSTSPVWTGGPNYAGFIGTTGAVDLSVATNNVERFRITSSGTFQMMYSHTALSLPFNIQDDLGYGLYLSDENTLNFDYGQNALSDFYFSFRGYNGGGTQFRNMHFCDGKATDIVLMSGASGTTLFTPKANNFSAVFISPNVASQSYGPNIEAGTNSADLGFNVVNAANTVNLFQVRGDGQIIFGGISTTASAANAFLNTSANILLKSTSSIRYKTDVIDLSDFVAERFVRTARPVRYRSKAENDRKDWSHYGFIAEELAQIDPRLVNYTNDEPDGVQYDRVGVLLTSVVKSLLDRVDALEKRCYINATDFPH